MSEYKEPCKIYNYSEQPLITYKAYNSIYIYTVIHERTYPKLPILQ
ncbi:2723_t:CDS:1, partial [Cetraspora pellucida]